LEFRPVLSDGDIGGVACMADEIWHEYWPGIIGSAQTDYMVEAFQSASAITAAIREEGYEYWVLEAEGRRVGYAAVRVEAPDARLFISKVYLFAAERGRGFASEAIAFFEALCHGRGLTTMYLSVNKHNELALRAYRAKGFAVVGASVKGIGQGFFLDDYLMEKVL